jgi:hypothetical protein
MFAKVLGVVVGPGVGEEVGEGEAVGEGVGVGEAVPPISEVESPALLVKVAPPGVTE